MTDHTVTQRTNDEIVRAAADLDDLCYDQQRDLLAKEGGFRTATVDAERKKALKGSAEDENQTLFLSSAEPCADPVDGAELLNELVATVHKYIVLPEGDEPAPYKWPVYGLEVMLIWPGALRESVIDFGELLIRTGAELVVAPFKGEPSGGFFFRSTP